MKRFQLHERVRAGMRHLRLTPCTDLLDVRQVVGPPHDHGLCTCGPCNQGALYHHDNPNGTGAKKLCRDCAANLLKIDAPLAQRTRLRRIETN